MYSSAVALTTAVALGARLAQAVPSMSAEQVKRGLLDMQNCGSDADCPSGWTCNGDSAYGHSCALYLTDSSTKVKRIVNINGHGTCNDNSDCASSLECREVWGGYDGYYYHSKAVNVCLAPVDKKRSDVSARDSGNCKADSDCTKKYGDSWYCDEVYDGAGIGGAINVCMPDASEKRDVQMTRRDGTCSSDADCGSGEFCDEYLTFMTGTVTKTTGCFAKPAKRDLALETRAHGNCDADSDCSKYGDSWYCDQVYDGSGGAGAINVCLPGSNAKRDVDIARRAGTCESDADCASSEFCDEYLTFMTGTITKTKGCFAKPAKRDVEVEARANGNCDADSDCTKYGSSWYCDQVYDGSGGAGAINVCLPGANEKRGLGLTVRSHGNCEADSDCKKYGSSWTCDELYDGSATDGVAIKACIP
ncbi:hypothetical protein LIA77_10660 [Sarocladium implicatum]|nr:hypothetical protein LIA77_10660 [Sarocladium implicatum]